MQDGDGSCKAEGHVKGDLWRNSMTSATAMFRHSIYLLPLKSHLLTLRLVDPMLSQRMSSNEGAAG